MRPPCLDHWDQSTYWSSRDLFAIWSWKFIGNSFISNLIVHIRSPCATNAIRVWLETGMSSAWNKTLSSTVYQTHSLNEVGVVAHISSISFTFLAFSAASLGIHRSPGLANPSWLRSYALRNFTGSFLSSTDCASSKHSNQVLLWANSLTIGFGCGGDIETGERVSERCHWHKLKMLGIGGGFKLDSRLWWDVTSILIINSKKRLTFLSRDHDHDWASTSDISSPACITDSGLSSWCPRSTTASRTIDLWTQRSATCRTNSNRN